MTEVQQKPALAGALGTIAVWILIFLFFYFGASLFAPKPFKTIKIRLDAPQKVEKAESGKLKTESSVKENSPQKKEVVKETQSSSQKGDGSSSALTETRSNPVSQDLPAAPSLPTPSLQPSSQKNAKQDVKKSEPKKAAETAKPAKQAPAKSTKQAQTKQVEQPKMVEQQLQKSMEELMAEQRQPKKAPKKEFDWSQFDDIEGSSSSSPAAVAKNTNPNPSSQSTFSGNAASSSNNTSTAASAASSSSKSAAGKSASSSTSNALAGVLSAKAYSSSANGVSSSVTANTGSSSDGKTTIQMADGTPRVLLEPSEPKITLSKEASALIDSTKRLTVSFTVMAGGNVPVTSVKISPDILPSLVSMEIREQISRWRFQAASYDGSAKFDYTIQKQ